jgi:hypothetical protein
MHFIQASYPSRCGLFLFANFLTFMTQLLPLIDCLFLPSIYHLTPIVVVENEEAYAYYKKFHTADKPKKCQPSLKKDNACPVIKADRDQSRVRRRYMKLNREELVDQLPDCEQRYAQLHERYLGMNDKLLEWQLRAEQAETQLKPPLTAGSS